MVEILLVSDGFFHPPRAARRVVRDVLAAVPGIQLTQIRHLDGLVNLDIDRYRAIMLYFHHKRIIPEALAAFERFVQQGGGVLAIHSATASFKEEAREDRARDHRARYFDILGGRFTGHGPVESFDIQPAESEVFDGIAPFTVEDELYLHDLRADLTVHFTAMHEGAAQPVVWTRVEGEGRICYVGPGHRTATMRQPEVQEVLQRGLKWVTQR